MPRKRNHWRWLFRGLAALLGVLVAYIALSPIVLPWALEGQEFEVVQRVTAVDEQLRSAAMTCLLASWVFMVGASVGSFLNVVAWRMPRGESVVSRPSHCPRCDANIRARDNLPVFGWLLLGGRCRVCRLPISPRYPIVEAMLGFAFLALAIAEPVRHGANLPNFTPSPHFERGVVALITSPDWLLLGMFAYHCLLISLLAGFALIKYDFHRLPLKLVVTGAVLGFACPAVWPALHPLTFDLVEPTGLGRIVTGLLGLLIGALWGRLLDLALPLVIKADDARRKSWSGAAPALATTGLFLGGQAPASILLIAAFLTLGGALLSRGIACFARAPLGGWIALATLIHLAAWRELEQVAWWPGANWPMQHIALAVATAIAGVLLAAAVGHRVEASEYNEPPPTGGAEAEGSHAPSTSSDDSGPVEPKVSPEPSSPQEHPTRPPSEGSQP